MENITSIERAIALLEVLGEPPYLYRAQELTQQTGFTRPTVYRTLAVLEKNGLVIRDKKSGQYKVGPKLYHLGVAYVGNINYKPIIEEILFEITQRSNECVGIAVKEGEHIVSLFENELNHPMKTNDRVGKYCAINKGSYGKCLMAYQDREYLEAYFKGRTFEKTLPRVMTTKEEILAEYEKVRRQGYATSMDELSIDMWGTGIPLFRSDGTVKAAVAISYYRVDGDGGPKKLERMLDILMSYQKKLEQYLPDW